MSELAGVTPEVQIQTPRGSKKGRPRNASTTRRPCGRCRNLHLKCVWTSSDLTASCVRCERSGNDCFLGTKKTRFRHAVFPGQDHEKPAHGKTYSFVDMPTPVEETGSLAKHDPSTLHQEDQQPNVWDTSSPQFSTFYAGLWGTRSLTDEYQYTNFSKNVAPPETSQSYDGNTIQFGQRNRRTGTTSDSAQLFDLSRTIRSTDEDYFEYILMRYFCEDLAPWLDWCDPDRHFTLVIPQKTRARGPLRNSVLTFAARSLARNRRYRNDDGKLEWRGHLLPDLDEDVAVFYHNESIRDLLRLSMDPEKLRDELLLAAVITLRNDEEIGFHSDEDQDDQQLFRHLANAFIGAQLPEAMAVQYGPFTNIGVYPDGGRSQTSTPQPEQVQSSTTTGNALRDACIWTAFRQDVHAAMLNHQPVMFPLTRFEAFRQYHPAPDATWANRMFLLCADVTEFAYGSYSSEGGSIPPDCNNRDRWVELKHREQTITKLLPVTFQPIFYREPSLLNGIFPEAWYQDMPVICGLTYMELARLILEKFDPAKQQLAAASSGSHAIKSSSMMSGAKKILLRLCGISLSNDHCSTSLINACLGVALVGEYFDDPVERKSLLNVLALMYDRHSYPALSKRIADSLRQAWSSEEGTQ